MNEGWVRVVQGQQSPKPDAHPRVVPRRVLGIASITASQIVLRRRAIIGGHVDGTLGLSGGLYHDAIMRRAGLGARYSRMWPLPVTTNFVEVISGSPIGPRACSFCVEIPISAPKPNCSPSVQRVEALTMMPALSTVATNL